MSILLLHEFVTTYMQYSIMSLVTSIDSNLSVSSCFSFLPFFPQYIPVRSVACFDTLVECTWIDRPPYAHLSERPQSLFPNTYLSLSPIKQVIPHTKKEEREVKIIPTSSAIGKGRVVTTPKQKINLLDVGPKPKKKCRQGNIFSFFFLKYGKM